MKWWRRLNFAETNDETAIALSNQILISNCNEGKVTRSRTTSVIMTEITSFHRYSLVNFQHLFIKFVPIVVLTMFNFHTTLFSDLDIIKDPKRSIYKPYSLIVCTLLLGVQTPVSAKLLLSCLSVLFYKQFKYSWA